MAIASEISNGNLQETPSSSAQPRVVIVGAGFGGLNAAWALRRANVEVTIIDRRNHHLFQPLLYQVATAGCLPLTYRVSDSIDRQAQSQHRVFSMMFSRSIWESARDHHAGRHKVRFSDRRGGRG